jgi:hypothetical protein
MTTDVVAPTWADVNTGDAVLIERGKTIVSGPVLAVDPSLLKAWVFIDNFGRVPVDKWRLNVIIPAAELAGEQEPPTLPGNE